MERVGSVEAHVYRLERLRATVPFRREHLGVAPLPKQQLPSEPEAEIDVEEEEVVVVPAPPSPTKRGKAHGMCAFIPAPLSFVLSPPFAHGHARWYNGETHAHTGTRTFTVKNPEDGEEDHPPTPPSTSTHADEEEEKARRAMEARVRAVDQLERATGYQDGQRNIIEGDDLLLSASGAQWMGAYTAFGAWRHFRPSLEPLDAGRLATAFQDAQGCAIPVQVPVHLGRPTVGRAGGASV